MFYGGSGDNIELQKVALNTKVVAQLVAALESDEPIQNGWLPTLIAVTGMMRDLEGRPVGDSVHASETECIRMQQQ